MVKAKKKRKGELAKLKYFGRVLKLVKPHIRYIFIVVVSTFIVAFCYTFSLATLYPILKVLVERESIHSIVDRFCAENRMGLGLALRDTRNLTISDITGSEALQIVDLPQNHILKQQGINEGDFIISIEGKKLSARELSRFIASTSADKVELIILPIAGNLTTVEVPLQTLDWKNKFIRKLSAYIPREKEKMSPDEFVRSRMRMLSYIIGVLILATIIGNFFRFLGQFYAGLIGARTLLDLRRLLYSKVMLLPMSYYVSQNMSDIMSRFMQDSQDILKALRVIFGKVIREPFKAVGVFILLIMLAPKLVLMVAVIGPLAAILFRKFGKWIRRANEKVLQGYGKLLGTLESTLRGIRVVKTYNMENRERIRYFHVEKEILKQSLRIERVNAMSSPVMETMGIVAACGGIMWATSQVMHEKLDAATLGTILVALGAIIDPVRKLSNVYAAIQKANAAARRIFQIIDAPSEYKLVKGTTSAFPPQNEIKFENVTFYYPNSSTPSLANVNLTIEVGKKIALVGPNGAGKTTLISLLPRLFDPQEGRILWDNVDIRKFDLRSLRKHIAYISQEPVIFADTIRNNIAYGNIDATLDQIIDAAKKAHAHEFIQRLPNGYDTILGEYGITLSGGERQRLAIARAILKDAPVIIFDEATSQVDAESEQKIQDAMQRFMEGRTALVIAHRFSTINSADKIVVMDRGKILAYGSHTELIKTSTLYQALYQTQIEGLKRNGD